MMNTARICFAGFVLASLFAGCTEAPQGAAEREKVFKVKGKVTFGGSPVADATVSFSPQDPKKPPAVGRTDKAGLYTLKTYEEGDGAAAGEYVVLVTKPPAAVAAPPANAHMEMMKKGRSAGGDASAFTKSTPTSAGHDAAEPTVASDLPVKYATAASSDLKVTVKADNANDIPLDLKP